MKHLNSKPLNFRNQIATLLSSLVVWLALPACIHADEFPPGCRLGGGGVGNTSQGGINFPLTQAHVGDVVSVVPSLGMVLNACQAINATGSVWIASGHLTNFLVNVTLDPGPLVTCPNDPLCQPGPYNFLITPALVGAGVNSPNGSIPGAAKAVRAVQNSEGTVRTGEPPSSLADFHSATIGIVTPCIEVVKLCAYPANSPACFPAGSPINFTGYVTNCGDIRLTNVTVVDSRTPNLFTPAGLPLFQPLTLDPGQAVPFKGSFQATLAETCAGSAANTITVRGTDITIIGGPNASVTNSTTVSCNICVNPCLTVTKNCPTVAQGQPQTVSGVVSNCGNIAITNIVVSDNIYGPITTIAALAPGQSANYSTNFITTSCGSTPNIVTAAGSTQCGVPIQASATNTCVVTCPPKICVVKQVACYLGTNAQGAEVCGAFGESATGFKVVTPTATNLPAFCYSITVSNCGPVGLTNVIVNDDKFGVLTADFPCVAGVFAPGASCTFVFKTSLQFDQTNTVTASGQSVATGQTTTVQDTAEAHVLPASIACNKLVTSPDDTDGNPFDSHVGLPCGSGPHVVNYFVTVTNTGAADLTNIVISDPSLNDLCAMPGPFSLLAGTSTNFALCPAMNFDCGAEGSSNNCANPMLKQAAGCTVLQLGGYKVDITGPAGGILGDICIGPNGKLSITGSEYVTGDIKLDAGATLSKSGSGIIGGAVIHTSLSTEINAAIAASVDAAALPCTMTIPSLKTATTITGNGGLNVLCIGSVSLSGGKVVYLNGTASDRFVLNITGGFALSGGSQIRVANGVLPKNVLYNILGTGGQVAFSGGGGGTTCCKAVVDGTMIALQRKIALSPGLVNGQLIGGRDISIVSGSSVRCPAGCTPTVFVNTIMVAAEVSAIQSNTNASPACLFDINGLPIRTSSQCSATVECN